MRSGRLPVAAATLLLLLFFGCGRSSGSSPESKLTVLAAASLSKVFPKIGDAFAAKHPGVTFAYSFGGTDALAAQIDQGAPGDVFAGASAKYGGQLAGDGLIDAWKPLCTNRLVVVVPRSNPAGIASLQDLARPGVKLVVGAETVPIGAYTRTVLGNLDSTYGSDYSAAVLANVVSNENDVEGVLTKVSVGEADAGFVYVTDARAAAGTVSTIPLPDSAQAVATYPIAAIRANGEADLARQFVAFALGPEGQRLLRAAGFEPPPSSAAR
jgi:molybdate transport system substrate-binding protein